MNPIVSSVLLLLLQASWGFEAIWEGGTPDSPAGIAHLFSGLPPGNLYLTVEVYETDFSSTSEYVSGIYVNGALQSPHCDPGVDNGGRFFVCLVNWNISALVTAGEATVKTTASVFVNSNPYKGNFLYVRYTITNSLLPTLAPTANPSNSPTSSGFTSPPSWRPSRRPSTLTPSRLPSSAAPTGSPVLGPVFSVVLEGGTNRVAEGVTHTFFGVNETSFAFLEIDVMQTDFDDDDEYINLIKVNGAVASTFCNPNGQATQRYSNCLRNFRTAGSPSGAVTVSVTATEKVNCCKYKGYLLYVRCAITSFEKPTYSPSPSPSAVPTVQRSAAPSAVPSAPPSRRTMAPSYNPSRIPSRCPTTRPTAAPSSSYPTRPPGFLDVQIRGTSDVKAGVSHRFVGLTGSPVFLTVEVYPTDFTDASNEYVNRISANGHVLSTFCFPGLQKTDDYYGCFYSMDVSPLVDREGGMVVSLTATEQVDSNPMLGFFLLTRITISSGPLPSPQPTALPSGGPTALPTGSPSGLPSAVPSSDPSPPPTGRPSTLPTGIPTTSPSSQPSSLPSPQPSSHPSVRPTGIPSTASPSFHPDAWFEWVPVLRSKLSNDAEEVFEWEEPLNWNRGTVPGISQNDQSVSIVLSGRNALLISHHIVVRNLNLSGSGSLYFNGGASSLTIINEFHHKMQLGKMENIIPNKTAYVYMRGSSSFFEGDGPSESSLYISGLTLDNTGVCTWNSGRVIGNNSTFHNREQGTALFSVRADVPISIMSDYSRQYFTFYPDSILNVAADLSINLPAKQSVRDIIVPRTVLLRQGRPGALVGDQIDKELWALGVTRDGAAASFYETRVNHTVKTAEFNYTSVYDLIIQNISSAHLCAEICMSIGWCRLFDFDFINKDLSCRLSRYLGVDVGGLAKFEPSIFSPISHYEMFPLVAEYGLLSASRPGDKLKLINDGNWTILGHGTLIIDADAVLRGRSSFSIAESAELVIHGALTLNSSAQLDLGGGALRIRSGSVQASSSKSKIYSSFKAGGPAAAIFEISGPGSSMLSSDLRNISLRVSEGAALTIRRDFSSCILNFWNLEIIGGSVVDVEDSSFSGVHPITLMVNALSISDQLSILRGRNLSIELDSMYIGTGAMLSTTGKGFSSGEGPGSGANHPFSASGGSHGGLGGPGAVDASGPAYGSTYDPNEFGSGGGASHSGGSVIPGGSGGGVVRVIGREILVDGTVSSDGATTESPASGAGGGSGGSVVISAKDLFSGTGEVTARGGMGSYAGGAVAGGGGSGGRIAIYCNRIHHSNCSFLRDGRVSVNGGIRQPFSNHESEQAASGTLYVSAQRQAGPVSAMLSSTSSFLSISKIIDDGVFDEVLGDDLAPPSFRSAVHADENDNPHSMIPLDIYIGPFGSISLASETLLVRRIIGSHHKTGFKASVKLENGVNITLNASFVIRDADLLVKKCTLHYSDTLTIGKGGNIVLYESASGLVSDAVDPILPNKFVFRNLMVTNGGMLTVLNSSVWVESETVLVLDKGAINIPSIGDVARFSRGHIDLLDGSLVLGCGTLVIEILSSLRSSGFVFVPSVHLVVNGLFELVAGTYLSGAYEIVVNRLMSISGEVQLQSANQYSYGAQLSGLRIARSGQIIIAEGGILQVGIFFVLDGAITTAQDSLLKFSGGGNFSDMTTLITFPGSTVLFTSNLGRVIYNCAPGATLIGNGSFYVNGSTILIPPVNLGPGITIAQGGILELSPIDAVDAAQWNISNITVLDGGVLNASAGTLVAHCLLVDRGEVHVSANVKILQNFVFSGGKLTGEGIVTNTAPSTIVFEADRAMCRDSHVKGVKLQNFGSIYARPDSTLFFGGASSVANYGNLTFESNSYWGVMNPVDSFFTKYVESSSLNTNWLWSFAGVSLDTCAELCAYYDVKINRNIGTATTAASYSIQELSTCESFHYNEAIASCRLFDVKTSGFGGNLISDELRGQYSWDVYDRNSNLDGAPSIFNAGAGRVLSSSPLSTSDNSLCVPYANTRQPISLPSIGIKVINQAKIEVSDYSYLGLSFGVLHDASGELVIGELSTLAVSIGSMDTLTTFTVYNVSSSLVRNSERTSSSVYLGGPVTGGGTMLLSHMGLGRGNSETDDVVMGQFLALSGETSLYVYNVTVSLTKNVSELSGKTLTVENSVLRSLGPVKFTFDDITITLGGVLKSDSTVSSTDEEDYDAQVFAGNLSVLMGSSILYSKGFLDVKDTIVVSGASTISSTGRGFGLLHHLAENALIKAHSGAPSIMGSSGGSHGGLGGSGYRFDRYDSSAGSDVHGYGDYTAPHSWGTPGGCSLSDPYFKTLLNEDYNGAGGGILNILSSSLRIEDSGSKVASDGSRAASGTVCGGGSGGSIVLKLKSLLNLGLISANGGDGGSSHGIEVGSGGGGGGGRVSISIEYQMGSVMGALSANGGNGFEFGSAGTVFYNYTDLGTASYFTVLQVSNEGRKTPKATHLTHSLLFPTKAHPVMLIDVLDVAKSSDAVISSLLTNRPAQCRVRYIGGDGSGSVTALNGTQISSHANFEVAEPLIEWLSKKYGFQVKDYLIRPWSLAITNVKLHILDAYINATDVTLSAALLELSHTGFSIHAGLTVTGYVSAYYNFRSLTIVNRTEVHVTYNDNREYGCPDVESIVTINISETLRIDHSSRVHSDGEGCFGSDDLETTTVGGLYGGAGGGGGGHGGQGGHGFSASGGNSSYDRIVISELSAYDWKSSLVFGSGGGGAYPLLKGGRGGGVIQIFCEVLDNNGSISVDGLHGDGAGAGGGSGGSLRIVTNHILGHKGGLSANGGAGLFSAVKFGGPGGGGIISVRSTHRYTSSSIATSFMENATAFGGRYIEKTDFSSPDSVDVDLGGKDLFSWLRSVSSEESCTDESRLVGPGAGLVYAEWSDDGGVGGNSSLTVRNNELSLQVLVRASSIVGDVEVFSTLSFDLCSRYSDIYSSHLINASIDDAYIGTYAHLRVLSGSTAIFKISNDGKGWLTVPVGSSLYLPVVFDMSGGHWNVHGFVQGGDRFFVSSGANLHLFPSARWIPCYWVVNVSIFEYLSYSSNTLCSLDAMAPFSDKHAGRQNTFVFFSMNISGESGIFLHGGDTYADLPRALMHFVGSKTHGDNFIALDMHHVDSFINGTGNGYDGAMMLGATIRASDKKNRVRAALNNMFCGFGGSHSGPGGYCADEDWAERSDVGTSYGDAVMPTSWGGGGGGSHSGPGAAGGGSIHIIVDGPNSGINVMGTIAVNGLACSADYCGSGAGGSIWIEVSGTGAGARLFGYGTLSAVGGGIVNSTVLAGSGGRIAIYDTVGGAAFTGAIEVHSGAQDNYVFVSQRLRSIFPSTGSAYFHNTTSRENSMLIITNQGYEYTQATSIGSGKANKELCEDLSVEHKVIGVSQICSSSSYDINTIIIRDGKLVLGDNVNVTVSSVVPSYDHASESAFRLLHNSLYKKNYGTLIVLNNSKLFVSKDLNVSRFTIELRSGELSLSYGNNIVISPDGILRVSQHYSMITTREIPTVVADELMSSFGLNRCNSEFGSFVFSSLVILSRGVLEVIGGDGPCWPDKSVRIVSLGDLTLSLNGLVEASAVCYPASFFGGSDISNNEFAYCGRNSSANGYTGGGGGGNAGYGSFGVGSSSIAAGLPKGQILQPRGCGGCGGSVDDFSRAGGAGGGGIHFVIMGNTLIDGIVNVSGGSGSYPGAGGGAGGSIWMEVGGAVSGHGSIIANGGHGGISNDTDISFYGGGGSAGRVHINASAFEPNLCEYVSSSTSSSIILKTEAKGGLSMIDVNADNYESETVLFGSVDFIDQASGNRRDVVAGAAGTIVFSLRNSAQDSVLFVRSWDKENFSKEISGSFRTRNDGSLSNVSAVSLRTSMTSIFLNSSAEGILKLNKIYIEHGNAFVVVHNSDVTQHTGLGVAPTSASVGVVLIQEVIGLDAHRLVFDSDVIVEPSACQSFATCIECLSLGTPMLNVSAIDIELFGLLRVPASGNDFDGNVSLTLQSGSMLYISENSRFISKTESEGSPIFTFGTINLLNKSSLCGPELYILAYSDIILDDGSAIHSDGLSRSRSYLPADLGASGGTHGGIGLPGINDYYFVNSINASTVPQVGTYGDYVTPVAPGGSGGSAHKRINALVSLQSRGGSGGGVLHIYCEGNIDMSKGSRISANGASIVTSSQRWSGGGAGSGGSISLYVSSLLKIRTESATTSAIQAVGGSACGYLNYGGSGGGGRISIHQASNGFVNRTVKPVRARSSSNPFLTHEGKGVLSGAHKYWLCPAISAVAGLTMSQDNYTGREILSYASGECAHIEAERNSSLWTVAQLTALALQPMHRGTIYMDTLISAVVPIYKPNVTMNVTYVTWNNETSTSSLESSTIYIKGDAFDLYLTERPTWVKQEISICLKISDQNISATWGGYWRVGYNGVYSSIELSVNASSLELLRALHSLRSHLPVYGVNVNRVFKDHKNCSGSSYLVTFFSSYGHLFLNKLTLQFDDIYFTDGSISANVDYLIHSDYENESPAVSLFDNNYISDVANVSHPVISTEGTSIGYWVQEDVFRIVPFPVFGTDSDQVQELTSSSLFNYVGVLKISDFKMYPTNYGWFSSNESFNFLRSMESSPE